MKRRALTLSVVGTIVALLLCCSKSPIEAPSTRPDDLLVTITSMSAPHDTVQIEWTPPPSDSFNFYRVYRAPCSDPEQKIEPWDTLSLAPTYRGVVVDKNSTHFSDVPGIDNGYYLYAVRAVRVDRDSFAVAGVVYDTMLGDLIRNTNLDTVKVGTDVSFNIENGKIFTAMDKCSLYIRDAGKQLDHVRLTQSFRTYLVKDNGDRVEVHFDDPNNPPTTAEINYLIGAGWLNTNAQLNTGVRKIDVGDFSADDPLNPASRRTVPRGSFDGGIDGDSAVWAWTLKQGNGTKRVYAEFTLKDEFGGGVDTVSDNIEIQPWRVTISLRNQVGGPNETMRKEAAGSTVLHYVYKPWVQFSLSIFADSTFLEDFDYWLILPEKVAFVDPDLRSEANAWLETAPKRTRLTGTGAEHDDAHQYNYFVDPNQPESTGTNLSRFVRTKAAQVAATNGTSPSFALFGPVGSLNTTCIPGSYWGPNPLKWNSGTKRLDQKQDIIIPLDSIAAYRTLFNMDKLSVAQYGKKEFVIVTRFKGRYFGDTRVMVSGGKLMESGGLARWGVPVVSYFDVYPPVMLIDKTALTNGSVISTAFRYALSNGLSIQDQGKADISKTELIVARKPDNLIWAIDATGHCTTADSLSVPYLLGLRAQVFPFNITVQRSYLKGVFWDIDPVNWATGDYIMAVVASDEFGNEGLCQFIEQSTPALPLSNPFLVRVLTGK
jgi:hypothetical protein